MKKIKQGKGVKKKDGFRKKTDRKESRTKRGCLFCQRQRGDNHIAGKQAGNIQGELCTGDFRNISKQASGK